MAYNFGQNPSPQNNQTMPPYQQNQQMAVMPFQTQNVQPLFPQPQGTYLITMPEHITCVIDSILYDTFDCSDQNFWCIYKV